MECETAEATSIFDGNFPGPLMCFLGVQIQRGAEWGILDAPELLPRIYSAYVPGVRPGLPSWAGPLVVWKGHLLFSKLI